MSVRKIAKILKAQETMEGAGVKLKRAIGHGEIEELDPFLLFDDFSSSEEDDFMAGFPWHPHRGITTVTYILAGKVEHQDSLGHKGVIGAGDAQWMRAASGIIHQEMPQRTDGLIQGYQLWLNIPGKHKMSEPDYKDIKADQIPEITKDGAKIRVVAGQLDNSTGPIKDDLSDLTYFDVTLESGKEFEHNIKTGYKTFAYVIDGQGYFDEAEKDLIHSGYAVVFSDGETVKIKAVDNNLRFILIAGKPVNEPIAWSGPIVMNTQAEVDQAMEEVQNGNFVKQKKDPGN